MTTTRRSFLVGAGSIITAAFVKEAFAYAADTKTPMRTEHIAKQVDAHLGARTLYYERVEDHWRLHLGEPQFEIPEPQTLIENLRWHGYLLDTQQQIDKLCAESGWTEKQLFAPMNGWDWETQWEHNLNPEAQAFQFLSDHDIFPKGKRERRAGDVIFEEFSNPASCWRWVEVHEPASLTLLQARLDELSLGVGVRPGLSPVKWRVSLR
jgi:hypothetical protein